MEAKFINYQKVQDNFKEHRDYRIVTRYRNSRILVFTPHGGGIERGTSELVKAIAGNNLSYYLFEGRMPTACESKEMHITSTRFDEPRCLELVRKCQTLLSIHGCVGKKPTIYVGGKDIELRNIFIDTLAEKGYPIESGTGHYPGTDSRNICNRNATGKGVQFEFSTGIRRLFFVDWQTRQGRKYITKLFDKLVSDIRNIVL